MPALTLSPDTVIRFKAGRAIIHNPHNPEAALQTEDSAVVAFVSRFAQPQDPQQVLQTLPAQTRSVAEGVVNLLVLGGVLVSSEVSTRSLQQDASETAQGLRTLAQSVHDLAGDAFALGEAGIQEAAGSGIGLPQRIFSLLAAVDGLREQLTAARQRVLAGQLQTITQQLGTRELKLHLGARERRLEGWINIDVAPADLTLNLNWGLPFDPGSVRLIFAPHVLQRLHHPEESLRLLRECRRVLRPSGRLRVVVPDIEQCIRAYAAGDRRFFEERHKTWKDGPSGRTPLEDFLTYAGAGARPAQFLESHKFGYDFETLSQALKQAGFLHVERSTFMGSIESELRLDQVSNVSGAPDGVEHYSLFVEAVA